MQVEPTPITGCFILKPKVFTDHRGTFFESYKQSIFEEAIGSTVNFVQDNVSTSSYGVLRGLHFQTGDHAQAKLVSVLKGEVLDVAVDLRLNSKTYGQHVSTRLSADNHKQMFIPRGFAHGFVVLSEEAIFSYKCDNFYHQEAEAGIKYSDPSLEINWEIPVEDIIVSERDENLPLL